MSILTSPLKDFITVSGRKIKICTDYRIWLEFEKILESDTDFYEKLCRALVLCVIKGEVLPENAVELFNGLLDFYIPGRENAKLQKKTGKKVFDADKDAEYILASFRSVYGIDLLKCEMHWHEFLALLSALPANCCLMQIVRIRQTDISDVPEAERSKFIKLKSRYELLGNCDAGEILSEAF